MQAPQILVMPGAYDVLSALLFGRLGFPAIQGTRGGIAAALGYPDGEVIPRERFVEVSYGSAIPQSWDRLREAAGYGDP